MRATHHSLKFLALASVALVASCTAIPSAPPPTPTPVPGPIPGPGPTSAPAPVASAPRPHAADWRDAPQTPGNWSWSREGNRSVARFGTNALILSCDPAARTVTLSRPGAVQGPVPLTILTASGARALTAAPVAGSPSTIGVSLPARDGVLDSMAFTRGRFAVETAGLPTLYVPSWPEVSRVIEDCR